MMKTNKKLNLLFVSALLTNALLLNTFAANIIYAPAKEDATIASTASGKDAEQLLQDRIENAGPAAGIINSNKYSENTYAPSDVDMVETYSSDANVVLSSKVYTITEENNNFYCYANDIKVRNAWCMISRESFSQFAPVTDFKSQYCWFYFGSTGKAIKASSGSIKKVKIDDNYYAFNEYGQMLQGFFNDSGTCWNEEESEDPFDLMGSAENLYHADEQSGVLTAGWLKLKNTTERYENKNVIWMYFNPSNFRAVKSNSNNFKSMKIDGKTYGFDDCGVMLTGFEGVKYNEEHGGDTSKKVYFAEDGSEITSGFVKVDTEDETFEEMYDDTYEDVTIYLNKSGKMYQNVIKKIGSSYYGFDTKGALIKGLSVWRNGQHVATIDTESTNGKDFAIMGNYRTKDGSSETIRSGDTVHYFDNTSGARRTSVNNIEFEDNNYSFAGTNNGGYNGIHSNRYYSNGIQMKPVESNYCLCISNPTKSTYSVRELCNNSQVIVLNKSGSKQTSTNGIRDENDNYFLINGGHFVNYYTVPVKYSSGTYYFKSENNNGSEVWIKFGDKDAQGKTCVAEYKDNGSRLSNGAVTAYQIRPTSDLALNFYIN